MNQATQHWVCPQLKGLETLPRTLEILSPTVRMDAIAATAISEAINVYSTAVAPRLSLINWRKMDSILVSKTSTGQKSPPNQRPMKWFKESYLMQILGSIEIGRNYEEIFITY
jgi:hypothetical protein